MHTHRQIFLDGRLASATALTRATRINLHAHLTSFCRFVGCVCYHRFTKNQALLAARLFGIAQHDQSQMLQFFSNMESDRKYEQVQPDARYPYNVLIFNVSDNLVHGQTGDLVELNDVVKTLLDNILLTLHTLIGPDDTIILSSDHGFVELDEDAAIPIHASHEVVRYRYLVGHHAGLDTTTAYDVGYTNFRDTFTVAIGRHWFKRTDSRGGDDRYAHGGLSLAEMTVPGAVLRRITQKRADLSLTVQPAKLDLTEGDTGIVTLLVTNKGNVPLTADLTIQADTASEPVEQTLNLAPGAHAQIDYPVIAHYRVLRSGAEETTQAVKASLRYTTLDGKLQTRTKRVAVHVTARTDKVEFDLGDLPDMDI